MEEQDNAEVSMPRAGARASAPLLFSYFHDEITFSSQCPELGRGHLRRAFNSRHSATRSLNAPSWGEGICASKAGRTATYCIVSMPRAGARASAPS